MKKFRQNFVRRMRKQRGNALVTSFGLMLILAVGSVSYIDYSTQAIRDSRAQTTELQASNLTEAGVQNVLLSLWKPFKQNQLFDSMDAACGSASPGSPRSTISGELPGVGRYAAGVISYFTPDSDPYRRAAIVRSVGWIDRNNNGLLDTGEPNMTVDVTANFELARSGIFDYTYFINNYGWMSGFNETNLIVNGDMRANGNFEFISGTGMINGSMVAANNTKLDPPAAGLINNPAVKQTDASYAATVNNAATPHRTRMRQAYDPSKHGAIGSSEFEKWRDLVFFSQAQIEGNRAFGAALQSANGTQSWQKTSAGMAPVIGTLDTQPTDELVMPDLSDITRYQTMANAYTDTRATWADGSANPNYAGSAGATNNLNGDGTPNVNYTGAYVDVWTDPDGAGPKPVQWVRLTTNGVYNGSALLVGTAANPIRIHGPVVFTQDVAIKGYVSGQGTIYTGRNVHVIGSVRYVDPPSFIGANAQTIENANEKKNMLGLAARGSVILGNPTTFSNPYPLYYMQPPFTKGRYDEQGNYIPAFNAMEIDSSGRRKYQSTLPDSVINGAAEGVNQIDAVIYTNFCGGGNVGTSGGGMALNGTLIARDEAIVTWSLPIRMNYDNRIRERGPSRQPLIDLNLPRSPTLLRSTWQDRGFVRAK
ncbi:MAG: hypothetical protein KF812_03345 [Fimbriimonadaceae bacterium]|nr:hypothetical protein [Fimbriimonadaceae bacterium]